MSEQLREDFEELEKQIMNLNMQIRELNAELESISYALKGSKALDLKGLFQRVIDQEKSHDDFQKYCTDKLMSMDVNVNQKFEILYKDLELRFERLDRFKIQMETYVEMVKSKLFWRLLIVIMGTGALVSAINNDWWSKIKTFIEHLGDL